MGEFFKGWRRKVACVTLVMALMFAAAWIRSFVVEDFVPFPYDIQTGRWSLLGLAAENQSLILYANHLVTASELETDPEEVPLTSVDSTIRDIEPSENEAEPADALSVLSPSAATTGEWVQAGGPVSVSSLSLDVCCGISIAEPLVTIPFSWIVIPLTLMSAWLIVWKPRERTASLTDTATHA